MRKIKTKRNAFRYNADIENQAILKEPTYYDIEGNINRCDIKDSEDVQEALKELKTKLNGETFKQEHFGRLDFVPLSEFLINDQIQRELVEKQNAKIIAKFDPRAAETVQCFKHEEGPNKDKYNTYEGSQRLAVLMLLYWEGIIEKDFMVPTQWFPESLVVPGSDLVGEAAANRLFTICNTGKEPISTFFMYRNRVANVRHYNSEDAIDIRYHKVQEVLEKHSLWPSNKRSGQRKPGEVTHLASILETAKVDEGNSNDAFEKGLTNLDWTCKMIHEHFPTDEVDGSFTLALGRFADACEKSKVTITEELEKDIVDLVKEKFGSPKEFYLGTKKKLHAFQTENDLPKAWKDACLLPRLVLELKYVQGTEEKLPKVSSTVEYDFGDDIV
ncbi:hypothetical protein OAA05_00380 [bacterium]|nr:hypothetical protein [bacterium]